MKRITDIQQTSDTRSTSDTTATRDTRSTSGITLYAERNPANAISQPAENRTGLKEIYENSESDNYFKRIEGGFRPNGRLTRQELLQKTRNLSAGERIYREYAQLIDDQDQALAFLQQQDLAILRQNRMQFPELGLVYGDETVHEQDYFSEDYPFDILVLKHPCFSPVIPHSHSFFEALYVLQGSFEHHVAGSHFQMKQGDFCLVAPNVEHSVAVFDENTIVINLLIRRSTFENIFYRFMRGDNILSCFFINSLYMKEGNDYILFHTGQDMQIYDMILDMFLEFENKQAYFSEALNFRMMTFFTVLLRHYENTYELPRSVKKKNDRSYEILGYIQNHYREVTLAQTAEQFHFTEVYTSRLIRNITGMTFTDYLRKIRMDRCCGLLIGTGLPVSVISEQVGYQSLEHFMRTFKKEMGQTPGEYRRTHTNAADGSRAAGRKKEWTE